MNAAQVDAIFSALAGIPRLNGCLCAGDKSGIWDDVSDPVPAIRRCLRECKAQQACADWAASQPPNSINGVIGGDVYAWVQTPNRRKSTTTTEKETA
jgi:hypothetical protein